MAYHGVIIPNAIAAQNIDAYVRSAYSATVDFDNGNAVILTGLSTVAGLGEAWTAVAPSTGNGITGVWLVYEPELVWTGSYRGLDPDVRNFYNAAGRAFTIFKPQLGDIITLTAEALNGSKASNTFLNCTNTGGVQLAWAGNIGSAQFAAKLLGTTYISIGSGAIASHQVAAYQFEVVAL
jgi:hypothetical protein